MKMRSLPAAVLAVALALAVTDAASQNRPGDRSRRAEEGARQREGRSDRVNRFERLKQMRLIEELQLNEEESVRFMAKRREHEDRMRDLAEERNRIIDDLQIMVEDQADEAKLREQSGKAIAIDRKMFDERNSYQEGIRKMLTEEKFARLLIFERQFQHQVRDAMGRSMRQRGSKFDD